MKNENEYLKAKRIIKEIFTAECEPVAAAAYLSDEQLISLLNAITQFLPPRLPSLAKAVSKFLYAGCSRFDRWFPPSPYVVPLGQEEKFAKFVDAYTGIEKISSNSAVYGLHLIRDRVYRNLDEKPLALISNEDLQSFRDDIRRIAIPLAAHKRIEFDEQCDIILKVLNGVTDRSLRTLLRFRIPYLLHKARLEINFIWRGIPVRANISPEPRLLQETFVQTEVGVQTVGASRWQTGTSLITVELEALIDGSAYTPSLQALPRNGLPVKGWPKSFTFAFSIFHDLAWRVRLEHAGNHNWIPAPRDLSDLEFWVNSASGESHVYMRMGSPAAMIELPPTGEETLKLDLGELSQIPWATECTLRAGMYLELGDTNEALFWLNVAVESLIARRFEQIGEMIDHSSLAADLGSPKEFWADAEAIVSKQFPEFSGKVKWPSSKIHVSLFGKIKALYRLVPMRTSLDELLIHYRTISGERNDLFHGKRTTRTSVDVVEAARQAFGWIDANMWPVA